MIYDMKKTTKTVAFKQLVIYCNIIDNQQLIDISFLQFKIRMY